MTLPAITFAPLDHESYKQQSLMLKCLNTAHPVIRDGRTAYISFLGVGLAGGRIDMQVYLTGDPKPYQPSEITISLQPE